MHRVISVVICTLFVFKHAFGGRIRIPASSLMNKSTLDAQLSGVLISPGVSTIGFVERIAAAIGDSVSTVINRHSAKFSTAYYSGVEDITIVSVLDVSVKRMYTDFKVLSHNPPSTHTGCRVNFTVVMKPNSRLFYIAPNVHGAMLLHMAGGETYNLIIRSDIVPISGDDTYVEPALYLGYFICVNDELAKIILGSIEEHFSSYVSVEELQPGLTHHKELKVVHTSRSASTVETWKVTTF